MIHYSRKSGVGGAVGGVIGCQGNACLIQPSTVSVELTFVHGEN